MTRQQAGRIVIATWLIGVGVVFLVQQTVRWSWAEAWPMFIILAGVASFVGIVVPRRIGRSPMTLVWDVTWPVAWIVAGIGLLASTTGALSEGPLELLDAAWPWAAIALGGWFLLGAVVAGRAPAVERFARSLAGLAEARIVVRFGAGELTVHPAAPGSLIDGVFRGGVLARDAGPGSIELEQDVSQGVPWLDHEADWDIGVATGVPLDLVFQTGACRALLDLTELHLRSLELHTGASQTTVRLPRAAGTTAVRAETGAAEVIFEVPDGVAARIRGRMALGATTVDERRFPRRVDGSYASPDYETASNRVEIDANGGLGAVRVIGSTALSAAA